MTDIVDLVLADHEEFRRLFAHVEALTDATQAKESWEPLSRLLEVHALAEEAVLYPQLVRRSSEGKEEAQDAVHEHNEIRDAIGEVEEHEPGTELFLLAVRQAKAANDHHMAEEEQEFLPDFKSNTDAALRKDLGRQFEEFKAQAPSSLDHKDKDPAKYVEDAAAEE